MEKNIQETNRALRDTLSGEEYNVFRATLNLPAARRRARVKELVAGGDAITKDISALAEGLAKSFAPIHRTKGWAVLASTAHLGSLMLEAISPDAADERSAVFFRPALAAEPLAILLAMPLEAGATFEAQKECTDYLLTLLSQGPRSCQKRLSSLLAEEPLLTAAYQALARGVAAVCSYPVQASVAEVLFRVWRLWVKKAPEHARLFADAAPPALCDALQAVDVVSFYDELRRVLNDLNAAAGAEAGVASFAGGYVYHAALQPAIDGADAGADEGGGGGKGGGVCGEEVCIGSAEWLDVGKNAFTAYVQLEHGGNYLLTVHYDKAFAVEFASEGRRRTMAFACRPGDVSNLHQFVPRPSKKRGEDPLTARCRLAFVVPGPPSAFEALQRAVQRAKEAYAVVPDAAVAAAQAAAAVARAAGSGGGNEADDGDAGEEEKEEEEEVS
ncbi:unnamed protein product, partial [Phaeothamnion confervicola]